MPMPLALAIWSRINDNNGETSRSARRPGRDSRVARKYTADFPQPVRLTTTVRRWSTTSAWIAGS